MPVESTEVQIMVLLTGTGVLALGWGIAVALLVFGKLRRSRTLFGWGVIVAGLMVLATPLTYYLYLAVRNGSVIATPLDLLLIAIFAFLGGAIASVGSAYVRVTVPRPSPMPGP